MDNELNWIKILEKADKMGFASIQQLRVFALHAMNDGKTALQITGLKNGSKEHIRHVTVVRKLAEGSPARGYDGMNLLKFGKRQSEIGKSITMTAKGRKVARQLGRLFNSV